MATMQFGSDSAGKAKYDQYNNALNALNDAGRAAYGEDFNTIGKGFTEGYATRNKHKARSDTHQYHTRYGGDYADVNANENSSYANMLNDYMNNTGYGKANGLGLNTGASWDDYAKGVSDSYQSAMDNASNQMKDQVYNDYLGRYDKGGKDNSFYSLVDQKNQSYYDEAANKLKRDLARGYLNNAGYQTALNALQGNVDYNKGLLTNEGSSQYDTWNNDLNQMRVSGFDNGLDSLSSNANNYMKYYNNMVGGNMSGLGSYTSTLDNIRNYAGNNISDDAFSAALTSNTYDPNTYVATGAEQQGLYNPFLRGQFGGGRRKRMTLDSIGEY